MTPEQELRAQKKETKKYKDALGKLADAVMRSVCLLDNLMGQKSCDDRDKAVAKLANELEFLNDSIRYNELGINFKTDMKPR